MFVNNGIQLTITIPNINQLFLYLQFAAVQKSPTRRGRFASCEALSPSRRIIAEITEGENNLSMFSCDLVLT